MYNNIKTKHTMKKLFLIMATTLMATTAWAQSQLQSVKGKTKDGKSINVQYYKGTAQDYIESVKYQLVDELKAENKTKQNTINDLQSQLSKANKRIDNLNDQLKKAGSGNNPCTELEEQINQKQSQLDQLNEQLNNLNAQLNEANAENERLRKQVEALQAENTRLSLNKQRPSRSHFIGVEGSMGGVVLFGDINSSPNPWEKALTWNKQATVYYGTDRLFKDYPLSLEAGLGFRSLPMKATINKVSGKIEDCDGDLYEPHFGDCSEKLTMNCLEIPVRVCWGQPDNNKVSVYTKLGVTPSFILSSTLAQKYSNTGRYPQWNVNFENTEIEELGFFEVERPEHKVTPKDRKFNLWGNAMFGAYVPVNSSLLFNVGAKLDCPILSIGTFQRGSGSDTPKDKLYDEYFSAGLINYNSRMLIPSLQAGMVYKL